MAEETRISGRLPHLDLEIRHGQDASGEWLTLSMRAAPSIEAASRLFLPWLWWGAAFSLNPWLAWIQERAALSGSRPALEEPSAARSTARLPSEPQSS